MSFIIKFRNVSFAYPGGKPVLSSLHLDLPANKTILLKGENGVGKTTLASLAAGLLIPQSGRIRHESAGILLKSSREIHSHISYLQQDSSHNLIGVNPLEDLFLWLLASDEKVYETDVRIPRILNDWNLTDKQNTPLWELSSGELKCLALAGLSLHKSRYWILDEPLASLDENHITLLMETLKMKRKVSSGMLIISHQSELFNGLVDMVITLTPDGLVEAEQ